MGRRIKDTKAGRFVKEKAPEIADVIGEVLPDRGVLGVVKRVMARHGMTAEEIQQFESLVEQAAGICTEAQTCLVEGSEQAMNTDIPMVLDQI
jgi:hypothetical protein